LVIALFFLLNGQFATSIIQHDSVSSAVYGRDNAKPQRDSLGIYPCGSIGSSTYLSGVESDKGKNFLIAETTVGITHVAIVFANITTTAYMIAIDNNSLLNAKSSVYVIAQTNITVNGFYMLTGELREWIAPFPSVLGITHNGTYYQILLRQISSLNDIEDDDRPINQTASYYQNDLISVALSGIPAVLASLAVNTVVLVFIKSQRVQEGLPNDI